MASKIPTDGPPSYAQATGSSSNTTSANQVSPSTGHLAAPGSVPAAKNGISAQHRRSMEDLSRPLPEGWVRTFDPETSHQFYVDTKKDPPRSIWAHPHDDPVYLSTLSSEERERIEEEHAHPTRHDIMAEHTDEEELHSHAGANDPKLPPRPDGKGKGKSDPRTFGRKLKDKVTGTSHEQRVEERKRRAEEEERVYQQHLHFTNAMSRAAQTGQPQLLGKDRTGKDVYVEPPRYDGGFGYGGYGGGYGYNPYGTGIYTTPDARYVRPAAPYSRPYGYGYGGGYGLPLAGGLAGGLLLGGLLF